MPQETNRRVFAELVAPRHVSYSVRDERYKYIRNLAPAFSEYLFDLKTDPDEHRSLLPDAPPEAMRLLPAIERFVQLGQHGLHLSIRGKEPGARLVVEASPEDNAEIVNAFRFGMVTGDIFEVGPNGDRLMFAFTADDRTRHLVLQTRPEDSRVMLTVRADGTILAAETLDPKVLEVSITEAERLIQGSDGSLLQAWYLPFTAGRNRVDLDEETTRNLKALGYLQ